MRDDEKREKSYQEFVAYNGAYPVDKDLDWEDISSIRRRILPVFDKYRHYPKVIVACHGIFVQSLCGGYHPENGEIVEFEY